MEKENALVARLKRAREEGVDPDDLRDEDVVALQLEVGAHLDARLLELLVLGQRRLEDLLLQLLMPPLISEMMSSSLYQVRLEAEVLQTPAQQSSAEMLLSLDPCLEDRLL